MRSPVTRLGDDRYLAPYLGCLRERRERATLLGMRLRRRYGSLYEFASAHEYFGLHRKAGNWVFREWAPAARALHLVGDFTDWAVREDFALQRSGGPGVWEITLPDGALGHGDLYKLHLRGPAGEGERIPSHARRAVQDHHSKAFSAQVWEPEVPHVWRHEAPRSDAAPLIYEAHVGMAQEREGVGTYEEFRTGILPRIVDAGYNTLQLMAVQEHPYYGSFGYQVSSFFAASSRFGTPEELKALIDEAHGAGLRVIMDLVHSHAVKNEIEGLSRFDGTPYQYFHDGARGEHEAWDSRCFDYAKEEVLRFLLSNCRFWLEEYHLDGFRFDGVTSMCFLDHGLGRNFTSYGEYFDDCVDESAVAYLTLANELVHEISPRAITIAEDMSGMPGLGAPARDGGCGFDYRLAMGVPDCWFDLLTEVRDEDWDVGTLWHELTNRRSDERAISYAECHDQAIVGGKTIIFELIDAGMYRAMRIDDVDSGVDRGMALHKMIRLATLATSGHGYLNFLGNEFGHPEWIDFPREGNGWSYRHARRLWHLRDDPDLRFGQLAAFDRAMLEVARDHRVLEEGEPRFVMAHGDDKVLAFERGPLLFLFNFHPEKSFPGYGLAVAPGSYRLVLDSDEARFGGQDRLERGQRYPEVVSPGAGKAAPLLELYLPARTTLVLKRS
jgi:1,4-alpha-glucan branching enzyme